MKSRKLLERAVTLVALLAIVMSAFSVSSVGAQTPSVPGGGNPVKVDSTPVAAKIDKADLAKIDPTKTVRVIVQLQDAAVASYDGGVAGLQATSAKAAGTRKLDVNTVPARAYTNYLVSKQQAFQSSLAAAIPGAKVERSYQVTLNALAIKVTGADMAALIAMPEVKRVQVEREYKVNMDASLKLIGLGTGDVGQPNWVDEGLWKTLGGHDKAGKGMLVADIDSGITPDNPCFDGTGYTYPKGFPKGDKSVTNKKIIAAYAYFRADDPPVYPETPIDDPASAEGGHGTHTAGTMLCNYGTTTTYSNIKISGVAPKAQLMVYRVFYESVTGSHSAYTPELLAAIEQVVKDGADVVNNSWGGTSINVLTDLEIEAYTAAMNSGIVVVFSAGNDGPGTMTLGNPGTGESFITVAATTTSRTFNTNFTVDSRSDALPIEPPIDITGASLAQQTVTAELVDLQAAAYPDTLACPEADGGMGPLPSSLVAGKIVVVRRGVCALVDKVSNAAAGGAVGVIIRNVAGGATTLPLINPVLPTVHISQANGDALYTFLSGLPVGVTATGTIHGPAVIANTDPEDTVASFSSRGPAPDLALKPDISAPGVNILSSVSAPEAGGTPGFDFYQGTSMAAPHITGSAALLLQAHPNWTPQQIKSALMTTAAEPPSLGLNPANRGSGRVDLTAPDKVGATVSPASLSLGLMTAGSLVTKTGNIGLKSVSAAAVTYTITTQADAGGPVVAMADASVVLPAGGFLSLGYTATAPLVSGVAYGKIILTPSDASPVLHIPYYVRVAESLALDNTKWLLVDDDNSTDTLSCPDLLATYTAVLTALAEPFVAVDLNSANSWLVDWDQARQAKGVIVFSGPDGCAGDLSFDTNAMRNYLASGGKMVVFGQDTGMADAYYNSNYGVSLDMPLYFGAYYVQDDVFRGQVPVPAAIGDKVYADYMYGQFYDLDGTLNPAIDELQAAMYSDTDALPILSVPSGVSTTLGAGNLGTRMSSEPTIERVKTKKDWTRLGYNTELVSFGLEAVRANPNFNTSGELLDRTLAFLTDEVTVTLDDATGTPGTATTLMADASFTVDVTTTGYENRIMYYRWDFGDGTPIQTTSTASVNHKYTKLGSYNAYVEVMDGFGHKAVSTAMVKQVAPPKTPVTMAPLNLKTSTPTLRWGMVPGATDYMVEVWSMAQNRAILNTTVPASACVGKVCSLVTPTLANGTYKFKVRAGLDGVWGKFSAYRLFVVKK